MNAMADDVGDPQVDLANEQSRLERERLDKRLGRRKCCQCNGNGTCIRCECATSRRPCSSCLPMRRDRCANPARDSEPTTTVYGSELPTQNLGKLSPPNLDVDVPTVSVFQSSTHRLDAPSSSLPGRPGQTLDTHDVSTSSSDPAVEERSPMLSSQLIRPSGPVASTGHTSSSNMQTHVQPTHLVDVPAASTGHTPSSDLRTPGDAPPSPQHQMNAATPKATSANIEDATPPFISMSTTPFRWGEVARETFCKDVAHAYEVQTRWRKNTFSPPTGHAGTEYVKEHTRLLRAYRDRTPLERVALHALMVMPGLLLQKPHAKAGSKEFAQHLSLRFGLWKSGNINALLD